MAKVLFFNIPAYGHMNPTFPLVAELVRRGEQVIYYSSQAFQPALERAGATFRGIDSFFNEQTPVDENPVHTASMLVRITQEIIPTLLPDVTADKPDYILYDSLCAWGKCIAEILQVPAIASVTTLAIPSSLLHPEILASLPFILPTVPRTLFEGRRELTRFRAISKQLQQTYSIPRLRLADVYNNLAELNIVYTTRQLQLFPNALNEGFKFVGPSIGLRSETPAFPFDELGDKPVIYISLGTVFNDKGSFYRLCLEAFADCNYCVVMSVGNKTAIAGLGTIPDNFIVRSFVPQIQLLQHAALFITHSGMNSVSEGLAAGVPLLMIPQAADQAFVAQRVRQLGAGKVLRNAQLTPQRLRKTAKEILAEPAFRRASTNLAASFQQAGGPSLAVDEIEKFKSQHGL